MTPFMQLNFLNGEDRKVAGLLDLETQHGDFLTRLRSHAKEVSLRRGKVTIDDVRAYAQLHCLEPPSKYVWGAVFKPRGWVCLGEAPSTLRSNHAHRNKVWRWVG